MTPVTNMNPPDDIQDIVIAAIRKVMALPESMPIIPQHDLADDFLAYELDVAEIMEEIEEEYNIDIMSPQFDIITVADLVQHCVSTVQRSIGPLPTR